MIGARYDVEAMAAQVPTKARMMRRLRVEPPFGIRKRMLMKNRAVQNSQKGLKNGRWARSCDSTAKGHVSTAKAETLARSRWTCLSVAPIILL